MLGQRFTAHTPVQRREEWIVHPIHLRQRNECGVVGCGMNRGKYTLRSLPHGTVGVNCTSSSRIKAGRWWNHGGMRCGIIRGEHNGVSELV
jgi:hypothetical protein